MSDPRQREAKRIRREYQRRQREIEPGFYALDRPANLFARHTQERALAAALRHGGLLPLAGRRVLEVGCGSGQWLASCEAFGATRHQLAAIELDEDRWRAAGERFPGADLRHGDASELPWTDASFEVVLQSTVFTSILDPAVRLAVAAEMLRVLAPDGRILWYDFSYNNPANSQVRGVRRQELDQLFPGCRIWARRVTLAPPLARRLVPQSRLAAELLQSLRLFNTHLFACIERLP